MGGHTESMGSLHHYLWHRGHSLLLFILIFVPILISGLLVGILVKVSFIKLSLIKVGIVFINCQVLAPLIFSTDDGHRGGKGEGKGSEDLKVHC